MRARELNRWLAEAYRLTNMFALTAHALYLFWFALWLMLSVLEVTTARGDAVEADAA